MNVRLLESDVLLASLPPEPQAQPELRLLWRHLSERAPLHLVIDMSRVEVITSPSIGTLLLLRRLQSERGVRLLLCQPRLATKCILRVVGLDAIFDYAKDKPDALKLLRQWQGHSAEALGMGPERDPVRSRQWFRQASGLMGSQKSAGESI